MSRQSFLGMGSAAFHRIAYTDWGASANPNILVCVHGLTRNGRDFDFVAAALEDRYRILCPDVLGRGASDWAASAADYNNRQYVADTMALLARTGARAVDWLGTSMGGMMGMLAASMPGTPVRRLILNDIGPWITKASLERIRGYVGSDPHFAGIADVEAYVRTVHAPFGALSDRQWRHLAVHSAREAEGGGYRLAYDPGIGNAFFKDPLGDIDLWEMWDRIDVPVLVLRGAASDLLTREVAAEMTRRGPKATLVEIPDCGHAPALMDPAQIAVVRDWLLG